MYLRDDKEGEPLNMNDTPTSASQVASLLAPLFLNILREDDVSFEAFEAEAIRIGHAVTAEAMSMALERLDAVLCANLPEGCRVHDRRLKTLATEVGDLSFVYRRVRDRFGNTVIPCADALDLPWNARVSPAARAFLIEAGATVSFQKAANLLARNGSRVSATTVMNSVRRIGELCAEEDAKLAEDLFVNGVVPEGEVESAQVLVEADGTWIRLQNVRDGEPERVEIKALVAYGSKEERGGKTSRTNCVHHGCVASPDAFWTQAVAAIGTKFDLSKVESCHIGTDGEAWCKRGAEFLPSRISTSGHLDPFHVSRAVASCFGADRMRGAWHVIDVLNDGDVEEAASLLEAMAGAGLAREGRVPKVAAYLRNNAELIGAPGPSLGTMESENQHLYGARMDSVPCAWSREGTSAMARIISRRSSKRDLPKVTRASSVTRRRARRSEERIARALFPKGAGKVVESVGSGYLPPHRASVAGLSAEVRYAAGVDLGMVAVQG